MQDKQEHSGHGYSARVFDGLSNEREQFERELLSSGVVLPLSHRIVWARSQANLQQWFLAVRNAAGKGCGGFAIDVNRNRILPAHRTAVVERLDPELLGAAWQVALETLVGCMRHRPRILRLYLELFSRDHASRKSAAATLSALGFRRSAHPRSYSHTVAVKLAPAESEILAALHPTARRHIRSVKNKPVRIEIIAKDVYAHRMTQLVRETFARTDARAPAYDWPRLIAFSRNHSDLSRIIGLFRDADTGPDALLAFAWGRLHGEHADYAVAASTKSDDLNVPLGYALAWDLIRWAKRHGASWFDFGGITAGSHGGEDVLGGVSDFKRYFSREVIEVGEEWMFELHPRRAKIARALSTGINRLRDTLAR